MVKKAKGLEIVFKNGLIKNYYNIVDHNIMRIVGERFMIINYLDYSKTENAEFIRLDEIDSWALNGIERTESEEEESEEETND